MELQERLEKIKRDNDRKKQEKSRLEGRLESLHQTMKEKFGCDTLEQLQEEITKLEPEIKELEADVDEKLKQMEQYA